MLREQSTETHTVHKYFAVADGGSPGYLYIVTSEVSAYQYVTPRS